MALYNTRTLVSGSAVVTITNEAQINNLDVSNFNKLIVSNISNSSEEAAYCSVEVNGKPYSSGATIDISTLSTLNLKCRYYRGSVGVGTNSRTVSMKVTLSN